MKDLKHLKRFNESKENLSDVGEIKIWTVIPYFSDGNEVNQSLVKSFTTFKKAEEYTWTLQTHFDVVENEISGVMKSVCVCKNRQDQFKRGDTWICGDCEEEIKQTVL
jgi:hypothetical protein